jgi:rhodanese-related sulfurtransferase
LQLRHDPSVTPTSDIGQGRSADFVATPAAPDAARDTEAMSETHDERPRITLDHMVADAKARIEELTVDELQAEIDAGDVTVIDIRDVRERWDKGAIPGAKSMPRGMLEFWFAPESPYFRGGLDFDHRYVLHCAGGQRSALAAAVLQDLGYTNVAHLEVGFNGWKDAGGAVETVDPDPKYYPSTGESPVSN